MDELIGLRLGNFTLTQRLGEGGMGTVFLAEHNLIARRKAVKVLGEEAARSVVLVRRFFDEAVAASACEHDHIVAIEDCGTFHAEGRAYHYIEMEYLDGMDVGAACRAAPTNRFDDVDRAVKIIGYAADALAAAHARGVVHRDVKPENLFLAKRGRRTDYVKVLDFGIARLTGDLAPGTRTRTGQILGTPEYMSPEQAGGLHVDGKSDVWSLAVVLYRMLAGTPPFRADTFALLASKIRGEQPHPLALLRPDVPMGVLRAVDAAFEKRPEDRPTMAEWRDLLLAADAAPRAIQPELSIRQPNSLRHVSSPHVAPRPHAHVVASSRHAVPTPRLVAPLVAPATTTTDTTPASGNVAWSRRGGGRND
jgi:serine/threonine-protein kinase